MSEHVRGLLLVAGAAVVWSTGGLVARLIETQDSWTTIFWRSTSAFVALLAFLFIVEGRSALRRFVQMGWPGLVVGLCFAAASISFVIALSLTSVAKTLVIMSATPLIAAVLGRVFLNETIGRKTYATIAAVMVGTAIMVSGGDTEGSLLGDLFAGVIALSLAGAIVTTRSNPHIRMLPATCLGTGIAALVALPFADPLGVSAHDLPIMLFFGAVQLSLGLVLFVAGVRLIPAAHSALLGMIEPIFGPLWVWIAIGEEPATTVLIGGAIVIISVAAKTLLDARPRPDVPMA
jgi:drug/metabolite transporter (DMT)-like permease